MLEMFRVGLLRSALQVRVDRRKKKIPTTENVSVIGIFVVRLSYLNAIAPNGSGVFI